MITEKEEKSTEVKELAKYIQETLDICLKENEQWKMRVSFLFEQYKRLQNLQHYEREKNPALVSAFLTIQSHSYQEKEFDKEKLLTRMRKETELLRSKIEESRTTAKSEGEIKKESEKERPNRERTEAEIALEADEFLKRHEFKKK